MHTRSRLATETLSFANFNVRRFDEMTSEVLASLAACCSSGTVFLLFFARFIAQSVVAEGTASQDTRLGTRSVLYSTVDLRINSIIMSRGH